LKAPLTNWAPLGALAQFAASTVRPRISNWSDGLADTTACRVAFGSLGSSLDASEYSIWSGSTAPGHARCGRGCLQSHCHGSCAPVPPEQAWPFRRGQSFSFAFAQEGLTLDPFLFTTVPTTYYGQFLYVYTNWILESLVVGCESPRREDALASGRVPPSSKTGRGARFQLGATEPSFWF
jgi:hypothetical protein